MAFDHIEFIKTMRESMGILEQIRDTRPGPGAGEAEIWAWKVQAAQVIKPAIDKMWGIIQASGEAESMPIYHEAKATYERLSETIKSFTSH